MEALAEPHQERGADVLECEVTSEAKMFRALDRMSTELRRERALRDDAIENVRRHCRDRERLRAQVREAQQRLRNAEALAKDNQQKAFAELQAALEGLRVAELAFEAQEDGMLDMRQTKTCPPDFDLGTPRTISPASSVVDSSEATEADEADLDEASALVALHPEDVHDEPAATAHWEPNTTNCSICRDRFDVFLRRHHCRQCGACICKDCSPYRVYLEEPLTRPENMNTTVIGGSGLAASRVCKNCHAPKAPRTTRWNIHAAQRLDVQGMIANQIFPRQQRQSFMEQVCNSLQRSLGGTARLSRLQ